jgi:hypothetical protein
VIIQWATGGVAIPKSDHKSIPFEHSQLETSFPIIEICDPYTALAPLLQGTVKGLTTILAVCHSPNVFYCLVSALDRYTLDSYTSLVFGTSDRKIFDVDMQYPGKVC